MASNSFKKTNVFSEHPGQFIIIDTSFPMSEKIFDKCKMSLLHHLTFSVCLDELSRIPAFGVIIIEGGEIKVLLSMIQPFRRSHLQTLHQVLNSDSKILWNSSDTERFITKHRTLIDAINIAVKQFGMLQFSENEVRIKGLIITILTSCHSLSVDTTQCDFDLDSFITIKLVKIRCPNSKEYSNTSKDIGLLGISDTESEGSSNKDGTNEKFMYSACEIIYNNSREIDAVFRKMISGNNSTSAKFVEIISQGNLVIKCDVIEIGIPIDLFPSLCNYHALDHSKPRRNDRRKELKVGMPVMNTRNLQLLIMPCGVIDNDSICQSNLSGNPYMIIPTSCWRLESEELVENEFIFRGLCTLLFKKKQSLLVKCVQGGDRASSRCNSHADPVHTFNLLSPISNHAFLTHPITVGMRVMLDRTDVKRGCAVIYSHAIFDNILKKYSEDDTTSNMRYRSNVYEILKATMPESNKKL